MPITIDPKSWAGASERDKRLARSGKDVMTAVAKETIDKVTAENVLEITGLKTFAEAVSKEPEKYLGGLLAISDSVIDFLLTRVTGLDVPDGAISQALSGSNSEEVRRAFGSVLMAFLDSNLDIAKVAEGFKNRNPGDGERDSMQRIVGTAFRIQVGDMAADWITQALPFGLATGLKNVAERFNEAMNLDDAIEDIIQVPMQHVIEKGMQEWYNRQLKPNDFSVTEVRQALLQEKIDKPTYDKILDNQGVRDDIRDALLDMAEPNLTESDIDQAYQHNLLEKEAVAEQYKQRGFRPETRALKTELVVKNRRWKLEEKAFELYGNLYRDGVATKAEVTPFLESYGYENDEVELWFAIQELERRQRKWLSASTLNDAVRNLEITLQQAIDYLVLQGMTAEDATLLLKYDRKWLTQGELGDLVKSGMVDPQFAIEYDVKQGMTGEDATLRWMAFVLKAFQKELPPDCKKILADAFSIGKIITAVFSKLPEIGLTGIFGKDELKKIVDCWLANANSTP